MKRKLDTNKIYNFIGRAVVYSTLYISAVAGTVFMFLQGMTYQEEKMTKKREKELKKQETQVKEVLAPKEETKKTPSYRKQLINKRRVSWQQRTAKRK